jgi:hypothetical protein
MGKKTCTSCLVEKDLETQFYSHFGMANGYLNKCKECVKKRVTKHRDANIERIREYDMKRFRENPERKKQARYNVTKFRKENPEKYAAQTAVGNAIRDGKLEKQMCCKCGAKAHAHHEDYSKPFDVIWLCPAHHAEVHKEKRNASP